MSKIRIRHQLSFRFWLGIAMTILCLTLIFRQTKWDDIWIALRSISFPLILVGQVFFAGNLLMRTVRWRAILLPVGRLSLIDVFAYLVIGYMANNVLPFRLGEFVRVILLSEKKHLSKSGILATVCVERLLDIWALLAFIVMLSFTTEIPPMFRQGIFIGGGIAFLGMLVFWLLAFSATTEQWLKSLFPQNIPQNLRMNIIQVIHLFIIGLQGLRSTQQIFFLILYSASAWICTVLNVVWVLHAFNLSWLPWYAAFLIVTLSNLGTMFPSSPGAVGVAHFFLMTSLTILSVKRSTALSFAIVHHGVIFLVTSLQGLIFLVYENLTLNQLIARYKENPR